MCILAEQLYTVRQGTVCCFMGMFKLNLGLQFYRNEIESSENCIIQMFHAGTSDLVKALIMEDIGKADGFIQVLVCTVAFGMGINCKEVYSIIHFGPSINMESYVQECGRAGRDGKESLCVLLHNGLLSNQSLPEIREYIAKKTCRRQQLLQHFTDCSNTAKATVSGCKCCDVCASSCQCKGLPGVCSSSLCLKLMEESKEPYKFHKCRTVTPAKKAELENKLLAFMNRLRCEMPIPVLFPNVSLEFGKFHLSQILSKCSLLFTLADIYNCVEIWRAEYAQQILLIISEVFGDIDPKEIDFESVIENNQAEETIDSDWEDVRDDSSINILSLDDTANAANISMAMHEIDQSDEELNDDPSGTLHSLACEASRNIHIDNILS